MSDLSHPAFTFDDLGVAREEGKVAKFVHLFSKSSTKSEEGKATAPAMSIEEKARKVYEDAYAEGDKAGREMGIRRAEAAAKRLEQQIEEVVAFKKELSERFEGLATEMALIFSEAIVLRECRQNKEILEGMIRKALEACEEKSGIVIRVRTEDLPFVETIASHHLRVIADDTVREPGFIIETTFGDIDGRISAQLEELKKLLMGHHAG